MSSFVLAQYGMAADRDAWGCPSTFGSLFTQLRDPAFECGWGNEGWIKLSGKAILLSFLLACSWSILQLHDDEHHQDMGP
jgi:hypothetical protein